MAISAFTIPTGRKTFHARTGRNPMAFSDFVRDLDTERRKLTVLNRTEPQPIYDILVDVFARGQENVDAWEVETRCGKPEDTVVLEDDDGPIAVSRLDQIRDAMLLVNSDIYITGARDLDEVDTPEVIARMGNTRMFAEGYPDPKKQKMLLIEISRYIEQRAWRIGEGKLYAGFQRLSRIDDEAGTREVYEQLGDTRLDVHAYGVPNWEPPREMGIVPHGHDDEEIRDSWFVVFDPPRDDEEKIALLAVRVGTNQWDAFWTHDEDRVNRIRDYLVETYD